jgi:hypothetical protein
MPISVPCPHCHKKWKLKDEYAGKRIKCPNAECGQPITIPAAGSEPVAEPVSPPARVARPAAKPAAKASAGPSAEELRAEAERLAAAMLNEEPEKKDDEPEAVKQFEYECTFCSHKWMLPVTQQGKNVLCPDCKARQRIPEKKEVKADWRDPNAQRPSLARGPELPKDLLDQQTKNVNIGSLVQAGAIPEAEVEPLPLGTKLKRAALVFSILGAMAFGAFMLFRGNAERKDNKLYEQAVASIADIKDDGGMPKPQAALFRAAYNTAAGEASIRLNDKTKVKDALGYFNKARQDLEESPKSLERDFLLGDLAVSVLNLGGTPQQVVEELRINWKPDLQLGNKPRFTGNGNDVQAELRRVLLALKADGKAADLDFRLSVARRVARALIAMGQLDTLTEILSQGFGDAELPEARLHIAYEKLKAGQSGATPGEEAIPNLDNRYQAVIGPDAVAAAKKSGGTEPKLQALALVAELSNDSKSAVAAALELAERDRAAIGKGISPLLLIRLNFWAGRSGEKGFTELIPDANLQALAEAAHLQGRIAANPSAKTDTASLPRPPAGQAAVGQALSALAASRQNARTTKDKKAAKEYEGWAAGTFQPAGLLGLVLGLQDPQEK